MDKEKTVEILFNLVSNYPFVVTLITFIGIAFGVIMFWQSIKSFRRAATSGVGLDSKTPSEWQTTGFRQIFFGMLFFNLFVFIQLGLESVGIVRYGEDFLLARDIFEETNSADIVSYLVWTFNLLGLAWFLHGLSVMNKSFDDPHYKRGVAWIFLILGVIGMHIYFFASLLASGLGLTGMLKWLGI